MKPSSYVGVSGIVSQAEVRAALGTFPDCGRQLMVGVLASAKTLAGQPVKHWRRHPRPEDIAGIFVDDLRCLNLVHYATDTREVGPLARELLAAVDAGGPLCHGLQLNIAWPALAELIVLRARRRPGLRMVLQLGRTATDGLNEAQVVSLVEPYAETQVITDLLLDASGGRGVPIDSGKADAYVRALRAAYPGLGVGVAGGLCAETLPSVAQLLSDDISVDAEGRLRDDTDGGGNLVPELVAAYLAKAAEIAAARRRA